MRFLTFTLRSETGGIHPVDVALASQPNVTRQQLLHVNALFNGYGVLLYRLRGDPNAVVEALDGCHHVIDYDVLGDDDGNGDGDECSIYVYVRPGQPAGKLMRLIETYGLVVDTPLEFTAAGDLRVTIVGQQLMIRQALRELPSGVEVTVEQAGEYALGEATMLSALTTRQRRVLETAVEMGYYSVPRESTQQDIADELGVSTSTVDEHLRKVEERILSRLVG